MTCAPNFQTTLNVSVELLFPTITKYVNTRSCLIFSTYHVCHFETPLVWERPAGDDISADCNLNKKSSLVYSPWSAALHARVHPARCDSVSGNTNIVERFLSPGCECRAGQIFSHTFFRNNRGKKTITREKQIAVNCSLTHNDQNFCSISHIH